MAREKILIVDDEEDFVMTVKYFLETNGYEVITASNGIDALKKAKEMPAIILLDVNMPGMNGFEVLHRLHIDSGAWRIPTIMLTVAGDMKSIREAQNLRATDYIMKTESLEYILACVKKYISLSKYGSDLLNQDEEPRKSGIGILNDVAWGKHICAFYGSKEDLLSMLIPYFKAGLLNNELCFWSLSEDLNVEDAEAALSKEIAHLDAYIRKGQMKIIDSKQLYEDPAGFDQEKAINFWIEEEKNALKQGFDGMRVSGSGNWAHGFKWQSLCNYEKRVNDIIGTKKVIAICTYSFYKFSMLEMMAVGIHHAVIIAKQDDKIVNFAPTSQQIFMEYFEIDEDGVKKIK